MQRTNLESEVEKFVLWYFGKPESWDFHDGPRVAEMKKKLLPLLIKMKDAGIKAAMEALPEEEKEVGKNGEAGDSFYEGFDNGWNKYRTQSLARMNQLLSDK